MCSTIADDEVSARSMRAERAAAATMGAAMFFGVLVLEPSWSRRVFAVGAVLFLWLALTWPRWRHQWSVGAAPGAVRAADRGDPELVAEVHAAIHRAIEDQDRRVCDRIDALLTKLNDRS
jgi:hypothetical protein